MQATPFPLLLAPFLLYGPPSVASCSGQSWHRFAVLLASVNPRRTEVQMHSVTKDEAGELAAALYRQRRRYLLAIAYNNSACRADAEEALQEALCAFVRAYNPQGESPPLPWLILTLKRECWRRLRLNRRQWDRRKFDWDSEAHYEEAGGVLESVPALGATADELMFRRESVRRRLSPLKADQRTALSLQAAGYSYEEIAEIKGWTYTKVSRCIREGREAMAA
jgi:RNA polymerase sigma factor (sigma-70 family)